MKVPISIRIICWRIGTVYYRVAIKAVPIWYQRILSLREKIRKAYWYSVAYVLALFGIIGKDLEE